MQQYRFIGGLWHNHVMTVDEATKKNSIRMRDYHITHASDSVVYFRHKTRNHDDVLNAFFGPEKSKSSLHRAKRNK